VKDENLEQETNENGVEAPEQTDEQAPARDVAADYLDALQRERASFINYKRRVEQERVDTAQYAATNLLKKLLPIMDDFDRALDAVPEADRKHNKWLQGLELIVRKFHGVMEQEGVEPIDALGQPFDPNLHEAVAFEDNSEGGEHADTVSEVFSNGYKLKDRVLKPAMVKVSRG
jgi:molecular chaperone GrpE